MKFLLQPVHQNASDRSPKKNFFHSHALSFVLFCEDKRFKARRTTCERAESQFKAVNGKHFVSDSTCICGSIRDRRTCNAAVSSITFHKHALQTQAHFIKSTCGNCIEGHYSLCRKKLSREGRLLCHGISPLDVVFESCSASFVTYMQLKSHANSIKGASLQLLSSLQLSTFLKNCRITLIGQSFNWELRTNLPCIAHRDTY